MMNATFDRADTANDTAEMCRKIIATFPPSEITVAASTLLYELRRKYVLKSQNA